MKPAEKYQGLKDLAEKLGIAVSEQNFQKTGVKARSGFCKVKGKSLFLMDKTKPVAQKVELLAECLRELPLEGVFIIPALRELLSGEPDSQSTDNQDPIGDPNSEMSKSD